MIVAVARKLSAASRQHVRDGPNGAGRLGRRKASGCGHL